MSLSFYLKPLSVAVAMALSSSVAMAEITIPGVEGEIDFSKEYESLTITGQETIDTKGLALKITSPISTSTTPEENAVYLVQLNRETGLTFVGNLIVQTHPDSNFGYAAGIEQSSANSDFTGNVSINLKAANGHAIWLDQGSMNINGKLTFDLSSSYHEPNESEQTSITGIYAWQDAELTINELEGNITTAKGDKQNVTGIDALGGSLVKVDSGALKVKGEGGQETVGVENRANSSVTFGEVDLTVENTGGAAYGARVSGAGFSAGNGSQIKAIAHGSGDASALLLRLIPLWKRLTPLMLR